MCGGQEDIVPGSSIKPHVSTCLRIAMKQQARVQHGRRKEMGKRAISFRPSKPQ
jgi:hypothetical protein